MVNSEEFVHIPVLFNETIDSLDINPNGIYVDCTGGGGGHSSAILNGLENGRLICIDRDPDAIKNLTEKFGKDDRVTIVHDNFFNIKSILKTLEIDKVDGILADLGVSSHQLDTAERGFSFHNDAPLDMRMSQEGVSAKDVVNNLSEEQLKKILFEYGEEKCSTKIAKAITEYRKTKQIETTLELSDIISNAVPAAVRREGHPARRSFQAIRIYVNGELDGLENAVKDMFDLLKTGGRVSVITFHSLEDKTVKRALTPFTKGCTCPKNFPVCVCGNKPRAKLLKTVEAGKDELEKNSRSRSAKLRTAIKID